MTCTECDQPARGPVPVADECPAHHCLQCADHCKMTEYCTWHQPKLPFGSDRVHRVL